ncbi:MAG: extracellular solute-binding protein [Pseudomonadota bacterium]
MSDEIILQSTTSTANSGLYDHLLPRFEAQSGIDVHVVAVGTGQAIGNAENCDGDVLLVHAKPDEEQFVARGSGLARYDVMFNDFVLVGPTGDPAGVIGFGSVLEALAQIASSQEVFASRGDASGTHKKEMSLWANSGIDPTIHSGAWYRETGAGMGATLNTGIGMGGYVLTDRATWASFQNKQDYTIAVEGDERLFNQYGAVVVNPKKCPNVRADAAQAFVDWIISEEGQATIAEFRVADQQVFIPNADRGN